MAVQTKCQTPGMRLSTHINSTQEFILIKISLPFMIDSDEAEILEANIHNAIELVMRPYFIKEKINACKLSISDGQKHDDPISYTEEDLPMP